MRDITKTTIPTIATKTTTKSDSATRLTIFMERPLAADLERQQRVESDHSLDGTALGGGYTLQGRKPDIALATTTRRLRRITSRMSRLAKWRFPCPRKGSDTSPCRLHPVVRRQRTGFHGKYFDHR